MDKKYKCEWINCNKPVTRFHETRVKSDGIHREIISVCEKHMRQLVKENKRNRI